MPSWCSTPRWSTRWACPRRNLIRRRREGCIRPPPRERGGRGASLPRPYGGGSLRLETRKEKKTRPPVAKSNKSHPRPIKRRKRKTDIPMDPAYRVPPKCRNKQMVSIGLGNWGEVSTRGGAPSQVPPAHDRSWNSETIPTKGVHGDSGGRKPDLLSGAMGAGEGNVKGSCGWRTPGLCKRRRDLGFSVTGCSGVPSATGSGTETGTGPSASPNVL